MLCELLPALIEDRFHPLGDSYLWDRPLLLTHLISDLAIGISYVAISLTLVYLLHRTRREMPFSILFMAFGLFIVACGVAHLVEAWTIWHPAYWLAGGVKVVTAAASVATALVLPVVVPRVSAMVHDAKLSRERELAAERAAAQEESFHLLRAQARELGRRSDESRRLADQLERANVRLQDALTDAEQARTIAEAANRAKSDFLAVMSHELRTPLNAIVGYTQLLSLGIGGNSAPARDEQLRRIQGSANHLVNLIDQMLNFTRLDAGKVIVTLSMVEAGDLVRETAKLIEPLAATKGLVFSIQPPPAPLEFRTDAGKVKQIILNLLSNAVKFTDAGSVYLSARQVGKSVEFEVRDTGIGLAPEALHHVFEPFWQAEQGRTRERPGTGLGLSVVRQLARLLGGDVRAESTRGVGSVFTVLLPLSNGPMAATNVA